MVLLANRGVKENFMPNISIIMGAYNENKNNRIETALESLINQTMTDWECIICDDASHDGTYEKLLDYGKKDNRFVIIKNDINKGLAYSLNRCLKYAKGQYIARMDLDDSSEPDRLKTQYLYLEANPQFDFCSTCVCFFDENGKWGERILKQFPGKKDFLFTLPFVHAAVMAKAKIYQSIPYETGRAFRRCEDYNLFMMWYAEGYNGTNIQQCLYNYRVDQETLAKRKYKERFFEAYVRGRGYFKLGLMPKGIFYVVKPLIVGLIPQELLKYMRKDTILYSEPEKKVR